MGRPRLRSGSPTVRPALIRCERGIWRRGDPTALPAALTAYQTLWLPWPKRSHWLSESGCLRTPGGGGAGFRTAGTLPSPPSRGAFSRGRAGCAQRSPSVPHAQVAQLASEDR